MEVKFWAAADALRNNMDAAEYKHVILGLIFLKYIFDAFEAKHAELQAQKKQGADPEDRDECRAASIFRVPKEARWQHLKASAPQPTIGTLVDDAVTAIVRDNLSPKGVLPTDFDGPAINTTRFSQPVDLDRGNSRSRVQLLSCDVVALNPPWNSACHKEARIAAES